ncbi:MAG: hypothetical protein ABI674_11545 [Spartobacteria bacterium]
MHASKLSVTRDIKGDRKPGSDAEWKPLAAGVETAPALHKQTAPTGGTAEQEGKRQQHQNAQQEDGKRDGDDDRGVKRKNRHHASKQNDEPAERPDGKPRSLVEARGMHRVRHIARPNKTQDQRSRELQIIGASSQS